MDNRHSRLGQLGRASPGASARTRQPWRWSPFYLEAQRRIQRGDIGEPQAIVSVFSGNLVHTGTHAFDVMRMMFGEIVEVRGSLEARSSPREGGVSGFKAGEQHDLEDLGGDATLLFDCGAVGTVIAREKGYYSFSFDIIGSEGAIRLGNEIPAQIFEPGDSSSCTDFTVLRPASLETDFVRPQTPQVDALVDGILWERTPTSSLVEGMKALEIALAIHASHHRRAAVGLPLRDTVLRVASR